MYQMGYGLGRHWATRDATQEQLLCAKELGDGKAWVAFHPDPAIEFTLTIDPEKSDFMGTVEIPSASFVAGFIDGAQTIDASQ
tara:strand:+ start:1591 stop:1839 length:249 start_codon:yes stop_codon:yes gene_type:complete